MKIPKNFTFEKIRQNHKTEYRYWYPDSSVIYFTTLTNTMNYNEIKKIGKDTLRYIFRLFGDSLALSGLDQNNLYWKDILLKNGITVGYSKVSQKRLEEFERAIKSLKIKYIGCKIKVQHM